MWEYLAFSFVAMLALIFLATVMGWAAQERFPWTNNHSDGGKRTASGEQTSPGAF